ncbi:MAG: hypothetical protein E2O72_05005 [Candidatus Dadabacteria bacterium]|nr:MAG: hypothetical protein E2O72_05005 [Candidatus Dadabacteria bacterium]
MSDFILGLDLGQVKDYTALGVLERDGSSKQDRKYQLRRLERLPLGTTYPAVVTHVKELMEKEPLRGHVLLVVDATGVGLPVIDLLDQEGLRPIGITITGGTEATYVGRGYHVPKRDLVVTLQVLAQSGRLKVAENLPLAHIFVNELLNFKVEINKRGHDSYEAWREGVHDDLVLAVALAAWYGQRQVRWRPL